MPGEPPRLPRSVVPRLAFADLWHEWILSFCIATALAAVLAPLLLLLGLKHGTIETMRDRLIQDPIYREIRPAQTGNFAEDWLQRWRRRPDVIFMTPTILRGASIVRAFKPNGRDTASLDMVPTAPGDPLLLENGIDVPPENGVVLTTEAASQLGLKPGATLRIQANRYRGSVQEFADATFQLTGVLPPRGDPLPRLYAPLAFTEDVEAFRNGVAVPARSWPGGTRTAAPSYDGVFIIAAAPFDALTQRNITTGTGFSLVEELGPDELARRSGFRIAGTWHIYDLHVISEPSTEAGVNNARERLRGQDVILIPYARDLAVTLPNGARLAVSSWSLADDDARRLELVAPPWGAPPVTADFSVLGAVLLPAAMTGTGPQVPVRIERVLGDPALPLAVAGTGPEGFAVVPSPLAGMLRTGLRREILYDRDSASLVLGRPGFGGFRLYARTIDDVSALAAALREEGIEVVSQVQAIDRIRVLDRGLTRMFWLVAVVGIVGGAAALVASLYAAVQRKRRDLGMMRLLGLPRSSVFLFPIYQSTALAATAALIALIAFFALAGVINRVFASDLDLGQRLCWLPASYLLVAALAMTSAAALCALMAGARATQVEPAEAIRDE